VIEYLYGREAELVPWAAEHTAPGHQFRPDAKAIGMTVDGVIRGVVVFDTFSENNCLFSMASDGSRRWVTREFIIRTLAYPFIQCGFNRITSLISSGNKSSIRFARHFGSWKLEGVMREAGDFGEDLLMYGLLKREVQPRWLTPLPLQPRRDISQDDPSPAQDVRAIKDP
jgi:RimJ/RimL family protein N-acetyltransferase